MEQLHTLLDPACKQLRLYSEKLVTGIAPKDFARKPVVNGTPIELNHPAFNLGHLSLYPALVVDLLQLDSTPLKVPANFPELFKNGALCHDDPEGKIYPTMQTITQLYFDSYQRFAALLPEIHAEKLSLPIGGERGTRFPTVGAFLLYILTGHIGTHLGQISAWRRCMGMKAA